MAERAKGSALVMGGPRGFNANHCQRKFLEKPDHLMSAQHNQLFGIHAVELEYFFEVSMPMRTKSCIMVSFLWTVNSAVSF